MCGIVGLLLKKPALRSQLGELMVPMLIGMTERGPDSAGLAVFTDPLPAGLRKISVYSGLTEEGNDYDWSALLDRPRLIGQVSSSVPTTSPETGTYRTYLGFLGYSTANDLAYASPQTLGYYMVQTVPEPGTWGLTAMGLMGVIWVRRRRAQMTQPPR